jgi:hypothetical protein
VPEPSVLEEASPCAIPDRSERDIKQGSAKTYWAVWNANDCKSILQVNSWWTCGGFQVDFRWSPTVPVVQCKVFVNVQPITKYVELQLVICLWNLQIKDQIKLYNHFTCSPSMRHMTGPYLKHTVTVFPNTDFSWIHPYGAASTSNTKTDMESKVDQGGRCHTRGEL